ncbi:MAG: hypothetical protein PUK59_07495 [Actinomycetaceae bacterium]|nr:hypothetical protein [Actinomycetaceae bacterium]MDY5854375.1 hypothetical protein [Arcanobacterium sp.]
MSAYRQYSIGLKAQALRDGTPTGRDESCARWVIGLVLMIGRDALDTRAWSAEVWPAPIRCVTTLLGAKN